MKNFLFLCLQFVIFLIIFAAGSLFPPFHIERVVTTTPTLIHLFVADGLLLAFAFFIVIIVIEALRKRLAAHAPWTTLAFMLAGLTAGIGGIIYASRLRSMSTSFDGGTIVLYVVASAVIGGTSMFGGRGHPLHPVLGGIVIAAIVNGMALLGLPAAIQLMATAIVLLASITVDVVVRRRGETTR